MAAGGTIGLGDDIPHNTLTPMITSGISGTPTTISVGAAFSLVLTDSGTIYSCGRNLNGQLGIGDDTSSQVTLTQMITSGINGTPIDISTGSSSSLILTDAGAIYGCGRNDNGQLGIGDDLDDQRTLTQMHYTKTAVLTISPY